MISAKGVIFFLNVGSQRRRARLLHGNVRDRGVLIWVRSELDADGTFSGGIPLSLFSQKVQDFESAASRVSEIDKECVRGQRVSPEIKLRLYFSKYIQKTGCEWYSTSHHIRPWILANMEACDSFKLAFYMCNAS